MVKKKVSKKKDIDNKNLILGVVVILLLIGVFWYFNNQGVYFNPGDEEPNKRDMRDQRRAEKAAEKEMKDAEKAAEKARKDAEKAAEEKRKREALENVTKSVVPIINKAFTGKKTGEYTIDGFFDRTLAPYGNCRRVLESLEKIDPVTGKPFISPANKTIIEAAIKHQKAMCAIKIVLKNPAPPKFFADHPDENPYDVVIGDMVRGLRINELMEKYNEDQAPPNFKYRKECEFNPPIIKMISEKVTIVKSLLYDGSDSLLNRNGYDFCSVKVECVYGVVCPEGMMESDMGGNEADGSTF